MLTNFNALNVITDECCGCGVVINKAPIEDKCNFCEVCDIERETHPFVIHLVYYRAESGKFSKNGGHPNYRRVNRFIERNVMAQEGRHIASSNGADMYTYTDYHYGEVAFIKFNDKGYIIQGIGTMALAGVLNDFTKAKRRLEAPNNIEPITLPDGTIIHVLSEDADND